MLVNTMADSFILQGQPLDSPSGLQSASKPANSLLTLTQGHHWPALVCFPAQYRCPFQVHPQPKASLWLPMLPHTHLLPPSYVAAPDFFHHLQAGALLLITSSPGLSSPTIGCPLDLLSSRLCNGLLQPLLPQASPQLTPVRSDTCSSPCAPSNCLH
ncbi:hypothetical protein L7F22_053757 [Adiantum nelumboides]|nr:hypothetical protein [Adiantum nelumboides]